MKKIVYITLVLFSISLAACTRESSKTTDTKTTTPTTDKMQEDAKKNTASTEKKTPQSGQQTSPQGSGNNSNGDTWKFTQKSFTKSYKGCDINKEDCTNIQIYYLEMTEGKFKKQIDESIRDNSLNVYPMDDEHYSDFDKLIARFIKDYEDFKKDVPDAPGSWYLKDTTSIVYNTPEILCVKNTYESYLGGAHGAYNIGYTNFDMRTGNVLYVKDVFTGNYEKKLNKLIEQEIRKHFEMKPNESLQEGGLFDNTVSYNENFAITKDGIEFLYNQYEIAAYAMGVIEVKLPYIDIDDIINKKIIPR